VWVGFLIGIWDYEDVTTKPTLRICDASQKWKLGAKWYDYDTGEIQGMGH
jgi:hypothetical protein